MLFTCTDFANSNLILIQSFGIVKNLEERISNNLPLAFFAF